MTAFRPGFVLLCPLLLQLVGCASRPVPAEISAVAACSEVGVVDANRPPPTPAPAAMPVMPEKPSVAVMAAPVLARALAPVPAVAPTPAPAETPRVSVSWLRPTAAPRTPTPAEIRSASGPVRPKPAPAPAPAPAFVAPLARPASPARLADPGADRLADVPAGSAVVFWN